MKTYLYLFLIVILSYSLSHGASTVLAQTKTASPSATITKEENSAVDDLKEKVARSVTRKQGQKEKARAGYITEIDDTSITIRGENDSKSTADLDNTLTQYYEVQGSVTKSLKKDNLKKDDYVFFYGPEINGAVQATAVYRDTPYMVIAGKITQVDKENYAIKVIAQDKTEFTFDIQTRTTQEMLDIKTFEINKVGFSKLKEGDAIHVILKVENLDKKKNSSDAEKLLVIPNEYFLQ